MRFHPEDGMEFLELHLERLKTSAAELGFAFDRHQTRNQIQALCFELETPAKIRLLLARSGAIALEAQELGDPAIQPLECIVLPLPVDSGDWRLRHKSTDRGFYRDALSVAHSEGTQEALLMRDDGLVTEGSWTNIFVERDGILLTPPAELGLLPGILRRSLLEAGKARESQLQIADLEQGFLLGNAVRGLMNAKLAHES
jgi:para-aminobenzoate synthetase/4-amino-4-deoxychorismate lyase